MKNLIKLVLAIALLSSCTQEPTVWEEYRTNLVQANKSGIYAKIVEDSTIRLNAPMVFMFFNDFEFRKISEDTFELNDGLRWVKNHKCNRYFPIMSDTVHSKSFHVYEETPDSLKF